MAENGDAARVEAATEGAAGIRPEGGLRGGADRNCPVPDPASAKLTWRCGSEAISYEAKASHIDVREDEGALIGRMFSLAYVADGDDPSRPVTFCYNGGPGCASVPINFGGIGPRRVATDGTRHMATPGVVEDNPSTVLRQSDLVFLDALGTGWSPLAEGVDGKQAWGVDQDADMFARAIKQWLEDNGRWSSPVYLFGESYGTVRNAVLMRLLGERDVAVAGVVMLSAIFEWAQTLPGNDLYYLGMLPAYAAAAQFFGKAGAGVGEDEWFEQALDFTEGTYAPALLKGDRLGAAQEASVAREMSELIGLSASSIARRHLRIELDMFRRELLAEEGKVTGRLDLRFTSDEPLGSQDSSDWFAEEDAADDALESAWTCAFRAFCHDELGYRGPASYLSNNYPKVGKGWDWSHLDAGTSFKVSAPNVAYDIATAMRRNPNVRVAILGGRFDAATTLWNTLHDISCQFLSPELRERVEFKRYGCGHMAYVDVPTLEQMGRDMEEFYGKR